MHDKEQVKYQDISMKPLNMDNASARPWTVDEALHAVGGYRRWHLLVFVLLGLSTCGIIATQSLAIIFIGWTPDFHCNQPTNAGNDSILMEKSGDTWHKSKCHVYVNASVGNDTTKCNNGWTYDTSEAYTIIAQWDLVCDKAVYAETTQTIYKAGGLLSEIIGAYLTDKFGRKRIHIICGILVAAVGSAVAFSNNFIAFSILRIVVGFASTTVVTSGFVLLMEIFDAKKREFAAIISELVWVVAYMLVGVLGYLVWDWHHLQLIYSLAALIVIPYIWIIPESPLWMAANGKYSEAETLLNNMAKWNNVPICNIQLKKDAPAKNSDNNNKTKAKEENSLIENGHQTEHADSAADVKVIQLATDRTLRKHTIIASFLWFTNFLVYYFLLLSSPSLAGNRFLNYFLGGLVEIPAYLFAFVVVKRLGRRLPLCLTHVLVGICMLGLIIISLPPLTSGIDLTAIIMILALVGKFGISATWAIIIPYTKELVPTNIRGVSGGIFNILGQIGGMAAPLCAFVMRTRFSWAPLAVCSTLCLLSGASILLLAETTGKPLPQTLQDVHNLYKNDKGHKKWKLCQNP